MSTVPVADHSLPPALGAPSLWFRVLVPGGALGPGKVELMRGIDATGSVSAAARLLGMSHARSVKLVAEINALGAPLVETRSGGQAGGGACLTKRGKKVLLAYEALEADLARTAAPHLNGLAGELVGG